MPWGLIAASSKQMNLHGSAIGSTTGRFARCRGALKPVGITFPYKQYPSGGYKEPIMATSDKAAPVGALLAEGLTIVVHHVGEDSLLEGYDRILGTAKMEDGTTVFQIGMHAPVGTMEKRHAYQLGANARIKRVSGNRAEIYIGDTDPAEGLNYSAATEVEELPF